MRSKMTQVPGSGQRPGVSLPAVCVLAALFLLAGGCAGFWIARWMARPQLQESRGTEQPAPAASWKSMQPNILPQPPMEAGAAGLAVLDPFVKRLSQRGGIFLDGPIKRFEIREPDGFCENWFLEAQPADALISVTCEFSKSETSASAQLDRAVAAWGGWTKGLLARTDLETGVDAIRAAHGEFQHLKPGATSGESGWKQGERVKLFAKFSLANGRQTFSVTLKMRTPCAN